MPISSDLFLSILAMDSYNRGYDEGIKLSGTTIGNATLEQRSQIAPGSPEVLAGFFAQSYSWNGQKIISYRGTEGDGDYTHGWSMGAGL
jgi:hypothetical protein